MAVEKIELTKEGEESLRKELRHLIDIDRPALIEELSAARALGDLSENADYAAAKKKQGEMDRRIKEIENILFNAVIINDKKGNGKVVALGNSVVIKDLSDNSEMKLTIVGTVESNPALGFVSNVSPLGKAIIGKRVGDVCTVKVAQEYQVEIVKIENKAEGK